MSEPKPAVGLSNEQLVELIQAAKTPYVDPQIAERKDRQRQSLRRERAEAEKARQANEDACNHLREDGSSVIAWHKFPNGQHADGSMKEVVKGVCMHCNGFFQPGHPRYAELLKVPTRSRSVTVFA